MHINPLKVSYTFPVSIILFLSLLGGCGMEDVQSTWRSRAIVIDGKNTEWDGLLKPLGEKGSTVGFVNDSTFVYLVLVTSNHDLQRQVFRRGIIVWFDRGGGKDKKFGIQYPLAGGGPMGERLNAQEYPVLRTPGSMSDEVELFEGDQGHTRMTLAQTGGIEVRFSMTNDTLVYEMKVPIYDDGHHPFAIGTSPGVHIGVGIETAAAPAPEHRSEGMAEGPGGPGGAEGEGMGGHRGGGRSGRGYGGGERQEGSNSSPIDYWARLQLSGTPGNGVSH